MADAMTPGTAAAATRMEQISARSFLGHPRGLMILALTEACERFAFSGMQSLLVLFMVDRLLLPGHAGHVLGLAPFRRLLASLYGPLGVQAFSSVVFGLWTSLVFFTPVFGGLLGDRWFGRRRMVIAGSLLMASGEFLMMADTTCLIALLVLVLGAGALKGNIGTQVGALYPATGSDGAASRAEGFQIFSAAMDAGVVAAPLVCGTLGETIGWRFGFGTAGLGMLVGLAIYLLGRRHLPADRRPRRNDRRGPRQSLRPQGRFTLAALASAFVLSTMFLISAGQLGNVYALWLRTSVDRHVMGHLIPVTWFQMLTPLFSIVLTPAIIRVWRRFAARGGESAIMAKMATGLALVSCAMLTLAAISHLAAASGPVTWLFVLPVHLAVSIAFICTWPVGLALFSRCSPAGGEAMYIGIFLLTSFVAANVVGALGTQYGRMPHVSFWLVQAAIAGCGALLAAVLSRPVQRILAG